jgi:hypothetical protein
MKARIGEMKEPIRYYKHQGLGLVGLGWGHGKYLISGRIVLN